MNITQEQEKEPKYATIGEVVMKKQELLEALEVNKAKHDIILQTAISGYWEAAYKRLTEKKKQAKQAALEWKDTANREINKLYKKIDNKEPLPEKVGILTYTRFNLDLELVYPEDHSQDYERVYRMMKSSVFEEVKLTDSEFDAYVLNNWEWKKNFLSKTTRFITGIHLYSGLAHNYGEQVYSKACNSLVERGTAGF